MKCGVREAATLTSTHACTQLTYCITVAQAKRYNFPCA